MNERVLQAALERDRPGIADELVLDTLVTVWMRAIYGTDSPAPA
jgi:hypothetical protein